MSKAEEFLNFGKQLSPGILTVSKRSTQKFLNVWMCWTEKTFSNWKKLTYSYKYSPPFRKTMMLEGYLLSFINLKFWRALRKTVCIVSSLFLSIITFEWNLLNVSLSEATTLVTPFPSSIPKTKIIY